MRHTFFLVLLIAFFLNSVNLLSQEVNTVNIPGETVFCWKNQQGNYSGGSGKLKAGKDDYTYRSYIKWNNIRNYIPEGSYITNVVFRISWYGSLAARLEYRKFSGGSSWSQLWNNVATGDLWGVEQAYTEEYSFESLKAAVQQSVNGGENNIWMGIKNQNENDSYYFVNSQLASGNLTVNLEVSYIDGYVLITQIDENNSHFGQVGIWKDLEWSNKNVPFDTLIASGNLLGLKAYQDYKQGSQQKYIKWEQRLNTNYINPNNYEIVSGNNFLKSIFKSSFNTIKIKNSLDGTEATGGEIEFSDPWFIDSSFNEFAGTLGNRGINAIFHRNVSPIDFSNSQFSFYKGVFLNQGLDWQPPYYSVKADAVQDIQLQQTGRTHKFYFQNWSATPQGSAEFQDANALETPVVFKQEGATVQANLKGTQLSNNS
ncbi:MAG: hypothetical protein HRF52_15350, partial [Ignavibacterium sp.]